MQHIIAHDLTQSITVIELILLAVIIAQINQDHVIQYDKGLREAPPPKKRENVGIFPKWGTPPPLPPVWE